MLFYPVSNLWRSSHWTLIRNICLALFSSSEKVTVFYQASNWWLWQSSGKNAVTGSFLSNGRDQYVSREKALWRDIIWDVQEEQFDRGAGNARLLGLRGEGNTENWAHSLEMYLRRRKVRRPVIILRMQEFCRQRYGLSLQSREFKIYKWNNVMQQCHYSGKVG